MLDPGRNGHLLPGIPRGFQAVERRRQQLAQNPGTGRRVGEIRRSAGGTGADGFNGAAVHHVHERHDRCAGRRDPERIQDWIGELSKSDPVVVFCAYGFHVGCKTAIALREAGFDAKYMKGGHSAWKAIGGPIKLYA